ncbi:MAG: hypothetical protein ACI4VH_00455 [Clostridia bacterium]
MEENIADALKMAGSVLLFVMGLSIAILSFSQARGAIDVVLSYSDRESLAIENNPRFYYVSSESDTNRYVGKETIIPTLYRAYKENYKIVFEFKDNDYYLFENSDKEKIKEIDLAKQSIGSDEASRQFLDGIIYGKDESGNELDNTKFKERFNVTPNSRCLYNYLTSREGSTIRIKESLGTYYMEDLDEDGDEHPDWEQKLPVKNEDGTTSEQWVTTIEEANRTKKRVITYTFE